MNFFSRPFTFIVLATQTSYRATIALRGIRRGVVTSCRVGGIELASNQPPLPFKHLRVPDRHVRWLALANAGDFSDKHWWFYPFKTNFLRQHALPDGFDIQIIVKKCWCGDGIWRGNDYDVPERFWERCHKCGGTGIYLKKKIMLIRWVLNGSVFHEPATWFEGNKVQPHETIEGLVKHAPVDSKAARRAMERLFLRYDPERLKRYYITKAHEWAYWKKVKVRGAFYRLNQRLRAAFGQQVDEVPF